jgi:hypothetical protein
LTQPSIRGGRILAFFAFDVADSIELEAIPRVLRPERARIARSRPAPEYVGFAVAPIDVALEDHSIELPSGEVRASVTARLFDFGAVSLCFALPLGGSLESLPALAHALALSVDLGSHARRAVETLVAEIRPALQRPGWNDLVEDYYVFEVSELEPVVGSEALLRDHAETLAATLSLDTAPLSRQQIEHALAEPISYTPADLVLADWNGALVIDADSADTRAVLEFLNVQLLELRFLDLRLDRALARFSLEVYRDETLWRAFRGPHRLAIRALSELTVETQRLCERVENALKLVPDVYLARVHRRSSQRLGLPTWERSVQSKLDAVRHLTSVLSERAAARRAEALELTIIALIALEIALALLGWVGD